MRFLLEQVADESLPLSTRIQCAIAVMPFRHPRLCALPINTGFTALLEAERGLVDVSSTSSASPAVTQINILPVASGTFIDEGVSENVKAPADSLDVVPSVSEPQDNQTDEAA
jgi:hypothetical protein